MLNLKILNLPQDCLEGYAFSITYAAIIATAWGVKAYAEDCWLSLYYVCYEMKRHAVYDEMKCIIMCPEIKLLRLIKFCHVKGHVFGQSSAV